MCSDPPDDLAGEFARLVAELGRERAKFGFNDLPDTTRVRPNPPLNVRLNWDLQAMAASVSLTTSNGGSLRLLTRAEVTDRVREGRTPWCCFRYGDNQVR